MSALTAQLKELREQVSALHAELVRYGLVVWTAGNVSGRVPGHGLMVIKPSGVSYDELTPDSMIVCDLDGTVVEGDLSPSSDTAAHAYVYRHMPEVGGVVHTHSTYACAWAARGEPVPCVLTAMADEFGGEIPVGPFALIGDDSIGQGIVSTLAGHRSPAVLMRSHGVFTIGHDARAAVKAAVMCEDVARSVHISRQLGEPLPIPAADIDRLYDRYQNAYGQPGQSLLPSFIGTCDKAFHIDPEWSPPDHEQLSRTRDMVRHWQSGPLRRGDPASSGQPVPGDRGGARRRDGCHGTRALEAGAHRYGGHQAAVP
jgi:L-ribulose-5-phosphate 4-epimerase